MDSKKVNCLLWCESVIIIIKVYLQKIWQWQGRMHKVLIEALLTKMMEFIKTFISCIYWILFFPSFCHIFGSSLLKVNFCAEILAKHCSTPHQSVNTFYFWLFYFNIHIYTSIHVTFISLSIFLLFLHLFQWAPAAKHFDVLYILQR